MFTIVTPLPGSKLYTQAKEHGLFEEQDWSKYSCWELIFVPKGLTKEMLKSYHRMAYKKFYFRPRLVLRHLARMRTLHDIKRYTMAARVLMKL